MDKKEKQNKNNIQKLTNEYYSSSDEETKLLEIAKQLKNENSSYYFHGSKSCCSKDTRILTTGGEKPISNIKPGDIVITENNKPEVIIMANKVPVLNHKVLEIIFNDGTVLKVSPNHPTSDMRLFKHLKIGEEVSNKEIIKINLVSYGYKYTYDILPDSLSGNYYANGILIGSTLKQILHRKKMRTA